MIVGKEMNGVLDDVDEEESVNGCRGIGGQRGMDGEFRG